MLKGRRCYCNRLYPGFRCAYCRVSDIVAQEEQSDPLEQSRQARATPASTNWWARLSSYGRSVFGARRTRT